MVWLWARDGGKFCVGIVIVHIEGLMSAVSVAGTEAASDVDVNNEEDWGIW